MHKKESTNRYNHRMHTPISFSYIYKAGTFPEGELSNAYNTAGGYVGYMLVSSEQQSNA